MSFSSKLIVIVLLIVSAAGGYQWGYWQGSTTGGEQTQKELRRMADRIRELESRAGLPPPREDVAAISGIIDAIEPQALMLTLDASSALNLGVPSGKKQKVERTDSTALVEIHIQPAVVPPTSGAPSKKGPAITTSSFRWEDLRVGERVNIVAETLLKGPHPVVRARSIERTALAASAGAAR